VSKSTLSHVSVFPAEAAPKLRTLRAKLAISYEPGVQAAQRPDHDGSAGDGTVPIHGRGLASYGDAQDLDRRLCVTEARCRVTAGGDEQGCGQQGRNLKQAGSPRVG